MTVSSLVTIPARKGKAAVLAKGQQVKIINTHGQQVIDTWAFNRPDLTECMSMEHSRASLSRIMARGRRQYGHEPPTADPAAARRHLAWHPRYADRRLRSPSL